MIYNAVDIAYYILDYSKREFNHGISNLKIQKILYFIQAEFLVSKNKPCFKDIIEAWDFGPVIPTVYQEFKIYGGNNIPYYGQSYGVIFEADKELINRIIYQCNDFSASVLVEITHDQKPWKDVYWTNCSDLYSKYNKHPVITNESIKEYFSNTEN